MLARLSTTLIYVLLVSVTIAAASPTLAERACLEPDPDAPGGHGCPEPDL
ncbi:hypothetical protein M405DRAFT_934439 [Rhizopogon salebrosus TDB-379]|nr:hypothetical protein M405DRAFT_934439 [Rhizopogon salebrosus TDB-379]